MGAYAGGAGGRPEGAAAGHFVLGEIAGTLKSGGSGQRGWQLGVEEAASGHLQVTQSLTGRLGGGGPDDNKAQGGFYVAAFGGNNTAELSGDVSTALCGGQGGSDKPHCLQYAAVRRLTPRECERLQGFEDDYTLIEYRGKPAADGPRYKALGNSKAVPVVRWLLKRIMRYGVV